MSAARRAVAALCAALLSATATHSAAALAQAPPSDDALKFGSPPTMVASDSITNIGVSAVSLSQVIFSLGVAPE